MITTKTFILSWLLNHAHVAISSLGRLVRTPFSSLMTSAVIGIALALPTALLLVFMQINQLSEQWQGSTSISVFLEQQINEDEMHQVFKEIKIKQGIKKIELVTPTQALSEFSQKSGFGEALKMLNDNPLPAVILIQPEYQQIDKENLTSFIKDLKSLEYVDIVQLDMQWVERLQSIIKIAETAILILAILLSIAVFLTIGNTIRLEIQNRRQEIEITKLIGATDAFIRRPFLYIGAWYGFAGAAFAWFLIGFSLWLLAEPIQTLATLYQSNFELTSQGIQALFSMMIFSIILGLGGAWVAVKRHLQHIHPH